ncbi:alpha/beta hydrolase-fold protein [Ligilactobacillus murinus]|uniref:alpha/beta hydrolase n=1 Tax=Ligilactobacillus TaxID=2767887 RepID=UPI00296AA49B|nr:alpha/beta hydrolase-fold protein [Ligilactobacillus murinus]WOY88952.1 alpha/beta hydrolase-fold protein [Ligilactobacillus murinus]
MKLFRQIIVVSICIWGLLSFSEPVHASGSKTETVTYKIRYQGKTYSKKALVYVPANYDKQKQYDVLYFLHGSGDSATGFYENSHYKQVLDKLAKQGKLKNTLVVFPTFYPSQAFVTGDYQKDDKLSRFFARTELMGALVPKVEAKYSTYAKSTTKKELQQTRAHRAIGGFSMGAITSWYVFEEQLPYFKTFVTLGGDSWVIQEDGGGTATKQTAKKLAQTPKKYPDLDFKILAGAGSRDPAAELLQKQIKEMKKYRGFNDTDLKYYELPGAHHTLEATVTLFEHYAKQIF